MPRTQAAKVERAPAWKPMSTCPKRGLVLLKIFMEGGYWPVVARYSEVHGGMVMPAVLGQMETLVPAAEAWAPLPPFDTGVHSPAVMSAAERIDYARGFDQRQFTERR